MRFTVKQARLLAGFTQPDMAKKLNINRCTYAKMEQDPTRITIAQAYKICKMTGLSMDQIIFLPCDSTLSRDNEAETQEVENG